MTRCTSATALVAAVCAAFVSAAAGQQPPSFRSETRLVVLHAAVKNARGHNVADLDEHAFTVYENGRRQPIALFRRDDVPVSLALLIDNSGSMRTLRGRVEAAALAFVRASNPLDEACVVNFADTPRLDVPFTSSLQTLEAGIARVDSIGGTALRDAIDLAETYVRDHATHDRRVVLVITDGRDNASSATAAEIQRAAEQTDTSVYAIGLFADASSADAKRARHDLDHLSDVTGGAAYYPASIDEVETLAVELGRQIRRQYTIAYAPANQSLDGTYRTIRVEAHGSEPLTVRTRRGYTAEAGRR